jgi:hypothetical protein
MTLKYARLNMKNSTKSWVSPLLKLGYKQPLTEADLYNPLSDEQSEKLTNELDGYEMLPIFSFLRFFLNKEFILREWKKELKKKKPSLTMAFIRIYWLQVLYSGFVLTIEVSAYINDDYSLKLFRFKIFNDINLKKSKEAIKTLIPLLISQILKYFEGKFDIQQALIYASLLCFGVTVNCVIHHPYFLNVSRLGVKMRLAATGLIYNKVRVRFVFKQ